MTDHQRIRNAMFRAMLGPAQPRKLALWERAMVAMGLHRWLIYKGWMRPLMQASFFGHLEYGINEPGFRFVESPLANPQNPAASDAERP